MKPAKVLITVIRQKCGCGSLGADKSDTWTVCLAPAITGSACEHFMKVILRLYGRPAVQTLFLCGPNIEMERR